MPRRRERLRLGACLDPGGHHVAAWRHPSAQADAGSNAAHDRQIARTAEAAKFDRVFLADGVSIRGDDLDALSRTANRYAGPVEPPTLPGDRDGFAARAVPELQRRSLFREDYEGPTLRENLGLPRPVGRGSVPDDEP